MLFGFNPPPAVAKTDVAALYDYIVRLVDYCNVVVPNVRQEEIDALKKSTDSCAKAISSYSNRTTTVITGGDGSYDDTEVRGLISAKYTKPGTGIPKSDLASSVQTSLGKADSALQSVTAHSHEQSDITGLSTALAGKSNSNDVYTKTYIDGIIGSVEELESAIDGVIG